MSTYKTPTLADHLLAACISLDRDLPSDAETRVLIRALAVAATEVLIETLIDRILPKFSG